MELRILKTVIPLLILVSFGLAMPVSAEVTGSGIISQINLQRTMRGLSSLSPNETLNLAAREKAEAIFAHQQFAHTLPEGEFFIYSENLGYDYNKIGENLAVDFVNDSAVVQSWLASPAHRVNALDPYFKETGVAVVSGTLNGVETNVVVQLYAHPKGAVSSTFKEQFTSFQLSMFLLGSLLITLGVMMSYTAYRFAHRRPAVRFHVKSL